jgi:hypothetical protein
MIGKAIDKEWKKLKKGYLRFLKPSNFDKNYKQLKKLKFTKLNVIKNKRY